MQLLLLSNSTNFGEPYMQWSAPKIADFLSEKVKKMVFIPYAGVGISAHEYTKKVSYALAKFEIEVESIRHGKSALQALKNAEAIAVGGGNTFQLFKTLQDENLMYLLAERVKDGLPFIGWSAGSNVACPSLKTTNDMPIVFPKSFDGLGLIPFQINPHYTEKKIANHGGESRNQRILEFLESNKNTAVIGLPEGSFIRQNGNDCYYEGAEIAKLFAYGKEVKNIVSGEKLNFLLDV